MELERLRNGQNSGGQQSSGVSDRAVIQMIQGVQDEIQKVKQENLSQMDNMKNLEDFINHNQKLNALVEEANKLWTFF